MRSGRHGSAGASRGSTSLRLFDDRRWRTPVITDPTGALEWMIGLPAIVFLGAEDGEGGEAKIHVETTASVVGCPRGGVLARVKDRSAVELVDLPLSNARPGSCGTSAAGSAPTRIVRWGRGPRRTGGSLGPGRCSPRGRPGGQPSRSAVMRGVSTRWRASSPVTGTPSTTPSSPTAKPSSRPTPSASAR